MSLLGRGSRWCRLLPLALVACGSDPPPPPGAAESPGATESSVDADARAAHLEQLRAVGYLAWDADADEALQGVVVHDRGRAAAGYNLYTNDGERVYLTDLDGRRVHEWRLPAGKEWCEYAEYIDGGKVAVVCVDRSVTVLDWDSTVLIDVRLRAHHDVHVAADGTMLVPYHERRAYQGRRVLFDGIAVLAADGTIADIWSVYPVLDELRRLHEPSPLDTPHGTDDGTDDLIVGDFDYYHLNSIEILPDTPLGRRDPRFRAGNWLICLRNVNLIAVLGPDRRVTWSWGEGVLELPHMPTMLDDGHILVFDNGTHRGYSRILEIDPSGDGRSVDPDGAAPSTASVVWTYQGDPPASFLSEWRGSNQRLANGNTLICESERGHAFEVTPQGDIVWEFWNPEMKGDKRKRIYRMLRIAPERLPRLETRPSEAAE